MKTQKLILMTAIICSIFLSCSKDKDETSPVITMLGKNPDTLIVKTVASYNDPGATAMDDKDGDITGKIVVATNVNVNIPGLYLIYYTVEDNSHNISERLTRKVEVVKADGNYRIDATCSISPNIIDSIQITSNATYDTLTLNGFYDNLSPIKAILNNGKYNFIATGQSIPVESVSGEINPLGANLTINFTYQHDFTIYTCTAPMVKY